MATKLLNKTAVQWFNEHELDFKEECNSLLTIDVPLSGEVGLLEFSVIDYEFDGDVRLLMIQVRDFVRFASADTDRALAMCNYLNSRQVGTFYMNKFGLVTFSIDCVLAENAGSSEFGPFFRLGMVSMARCYPAIMKVRWANLTIEDAMKRNGNTQPLTDEEISRLMELADRNPEDDEDDGRDS